MEDCVCLVFCCLCCDNYFTGLSSQETGTLPDMPDLQGGCVVRI